ncbi:AAA family ATPase [Bradyrhizobium sp. LB13.1]
MYDELFHVGVNVIRGENSSGKSTVLNFIYYGLGGDLSDWSEVALLCSRVLVEVSLNGLVATLSREISSQNGQPMEIFGGSFEASQSASRSDWTRYPYRRSSAQESFSQALFRLLGIPEVANDVSGNLTIHQILRLLYSDQLSPVENIFRFESRFDPPALRDAIGRLLAGGYESALYENAVRLRELTRQFDAKSAELRSLFSVLGNTQHSLTLTWLDAQRSNFEAERTALQNQIELAERQLFVSSKDDELTLKAQNEAYSKTQALQKSLGAVRQERDALQLAISDSASFISTLEQKLRALTDADMTARHIGDVRFNNCPACFAAIEDKAEAVHSCHLCRTPFDTARASDRIVALINDTALQLKQSRLLQDRRQEKLEGFGKRLETLESEWMTSSRELSSLQRLPSSDAREQLRALHRRSGYLDRQIEDLNEKAHIIQLVDKLSNEKNDLNDAINRLKSQNDALQASQARRLEQAYTLIADEVRDLLHHDLRRQDSFESAKSVQFDFATNRISVDGHSYFSASSRAILRSSFFLGFFAAATKDSQFRHPRFVMLDTIEDKGMEPERSHNFQNLILKVSNASQVEHQIIYATAMIAPDLDDEGYVVGKYSTRDDHTIDIMS